MAQGRDAHRFYAPAYGLAMAGLRQRYPTATATELRRRYAALVADVYVAPDDLTHREQLARSRRVALRSEPGSEVELASPEDVVIHKLRWYEMGGRVSDRQWRDVLGVLKVQRANLDLAYLERAAATLDLSELLARARSEAG